MNGLPNIHDLHLPVAAHQDGHRTQKVSKVRGIGARREDFCIATNGDVNDVARAILYDTGDGVMQKGVGSQLRERQPYRLASIHNDSGNAWGRVLSMAP